MIFASDNWSGVHPAITRRISKEAGGSAAAYGSSELDRRIEQKFNRLSDTL